MKKMMMLATLSVLMAGLSPAAYAYDMGRGATGDAGKDTAQLDKALNLTDDQRAKVQQVTENFQTRKQQAVDQLHQQLASIQQEEDGQIKAVLDADQQTQFDKLVQQRQEDHKDKWSGKRSKKSKESSESY